MLSENTRAHAHAHMSHNVVSYIVALSRQPRVKESEGKSEGKRREIKGNRSPKREIRIFACSSIVRFPT